MRDTREFAGLEEFLADRGGALLGTAVLLAGSREAGEDLMQLALERLLRGWHRIDGDPEGYLRRTLYHLAVDRWRWRSRHPEMGLAGELPLGEHDPASDIDLRDALGRALSTLPARQRAVLVLRYFEQLSEAEIAEALECSPGAVKSSASRGLQRLRAVAMNWEYEEQGRRPDTGAGRPGKVPGRRRRDRPGAEAGVSRPGEHGMRRMLTRNGVQS